MAGRYLHLNENLYFDTKEKAIVKNMGNRYVFIRHDRRTKSLDVKDKKRKYDKEKENFIMVQRGLYFDKKLKQLYRKVGDNLVLYSKDRRKETKAVGKERRSGR